MSSLASWHTSFRIYVRIPGAGSCHLSLTLLVPDSMMPHSALAFHGSQRSPKGTSTPLLHVLNHHYPYQLLPCINSCPVLTFQPLGSSQHCTMVLGLAAGSSFSNNFINSGTLLFPCSFLCLGLPLSARWNSSFPDGLCPLLAILIAASKGRGGT